MKFKKYLLTSNSKKYSKTKFKTLKNFKTLKIQMQFIIAKNVI